MPWNRSYTPFLPMRLIFNKEEQLRLFKLGVSRNNAIHSEHIRRLEKAGCRDWELCNYGANYVTMIVEPLGLLPGLEKSLGLTLKQLRRLKRSTLKLAGTYDRLFNARLMGCPIVLPGILSFYDPSQPRSKFAAGHLWALPQLLRFAAGKVESWPDAEYRRWLSDRNLRSYYLALLCSYVSAFSHSPHYNEIASLLTEIALWLKVSLVFNAEDVRKDPEAFKHRNEESMWQLKLIVDLHRADADECNLPQS